MLTYSQSSFLYRSVGKMQPTTSTPVRKADDSSSSESDDSEDEKKASTVKPLVNGGGDAMNGSLADTPRSRVNMNESVPAQLNHCVPGFPQVLESWKSPGIYNEKFQAWNSEVFMKVLEKSWNLKIKV